MLTLSSICNDDALTVPASECSALLDLYISTDGNNWTNHSGWGTDPDVNNWFGITTVLSGEEAYVQKICLGDETDGSGYGESCHWNGNGNNLVGTIPDSIDEFSVLKRLVLSHNP